MKSTFIIIGHRAATTPDFDLDDLAGLGFIDTQCRCIATAFCLSNDIRRDTDVYLILQGGKEAPKAIKICGSELRGLNANERSIGGIVRTALKKQAVKGKWTPSTPGTYISKAGFDDVLRELSEEGASFIRLRENGEDLRDFEFPPHVCFVLGDNTDLTESEAEILERYPLRIVTVGPKSYHADHCISVVQIEIDRRC